MSQRLFYNTTINVVLYFSIGDSMAANHFANDYTSRMFIGAVTVSLIHRLQRCYAPSFPVFLYAIVRFT